MAIQFDSMGREIPDQRPVSVPHPVRDVLADKVRELIAREFSKLAVDQGEESWEEANDFDTEDDLDEFTSPYEVHDMMPDNPPLPAKQEAPEPTNAASGAMQAGGPSGAAPANAGAVPAPAAPPGVSGG